MGLKKKRKVVMRRRSSVDKVLSSKEARVEEDLRIRVAARASFYFSTEDRIFYAIWRNASCLSCEERKPYTGDDCCLPAASQ